MACLNLRWGFSNRDSFSSKKKRNGFRLVRLVMIFLRQTLSRRAVSFGDADAHIGVVEEVEAPGSASRLLGFIALLGRTILPLNLL